MLTYNSFASPMLTDYYQLTMAYSYWRNKIHDKPAVFDLFFRENPFLGEFAIFAGLEEVLSFLERYRFEDEHIDYLCSKMNIRDEDFFKWLAGVDASKVRLYAIDEGTISFPNIPLIRVEGPLAVCQLLETPLLNLVNFPSLVATNASRFRIAAGREKRLIEFGLRRAQGIDGAVSASRYSYIGGFESTSNVLAGMLFGIPVAGTHAHSYVQAFKGPGDISNPMICGPDGRQSNLLEISMEIRKELNFENTNLGELSAFVAYALSYPDSFLALVDTYDTLRSGIPNFLCVALALIKLGFKPIGIRIDSGDLAHLSKTARKMFVDTSLFYEIDLSFLKIVASNNINEEVLYSLNSQGHQIDIFGIGTHLVTCQAQPALGGVYKLVEADGQPRIKISQDLGKVTIPGRKDVYRIYGREGYPVLDLMVLTGDAPPEKGEKVMCRHPFNEIKRAVVVPERVEPLTRLYWDGRRVKEKRSCHEIREFVLKQLSGMRSDHLRALNPTPYKISVTRNLYGFIHDLWAAEAPVTELG